MPRYKITIEYDGTGYVGWQRQDGEASIQGGIEQAIFKFSGETVTLFGAGRTDAGVHACAQVAHFDLTAPRETDVIRDAINAHMRDAGIGILAAEDVDDDFDARFHAVRRYYRYEIVNRRTPLALKHKRAWLVQKPLDASAMNDAASVLIGHHDFTTFRSVDCQAKSPEKTLDFLHVAREDDCIFVTAHARSFLHTHVRSMVGSLKLVGDGRWTKEDLRSVLEARDRKSCGPLAPPWGLYLTQVDYE